MLRRESKGVWKMTGMKTYDLREEMSGRKPIVDVWWRRV